MRKLAAIPLAIALWLLPQESAAGGALGEKARGRVVEESVLVVWSGGREHLFVAATVDGLELPASYVFPVPAGARVVSGDVSPGAAFARLSEGRAPAPLPGASPRVPRLIAKTGECETGELPCPSPAWLQARPADARGYALVPLVAGEPMRAPWVHLELDDAPSPFVPFSEPPVAHRDDAEPPGVDATHPPRVGIWVELGTETKSGAWEKRMDQTAEALGPALGDCYAPALARSKRLTGDVHVQVRVDPAGRSTIDGSRASSKSLSPVLRCFELALEKASWPAAPGPRSAPFEVHATLRPPTATSRTLRAYLLTSAEVAPHLGSANDPRVPPDTRTLVAREPEPSEIAAAFPEPLRAALGIDPSLRWRLLVLESTADPRPVADDLLFRTVAPLPPSKPGEAPLPILTRADRPEAAEKHGKPRLWKRRAARGAAGAVALVLLVATAVWLDRERASRRGVA